MTAEVCHIHAVSSGGPRYDKNQTAAERHSPANLVLMCGRHHKIIDTEIQKYSSAALLSIKQAHEAQGISQISPAATRVAQQLLANYTRIAVIGNRGNVAIQSPGAIQAASITIKSPRTRLSVAPPVGSIGANRAKVAYCQHLIERYQDYQKADQTGKSKCKFAALHVTLKRTFGVTWKLLDESRFDELVAYLHKRIDATIVGKLNKRKGYPNYSAFEVWQRG